MIVIKDDTEYIDINKSTFFNQYYVSGETIVLSISIESRLSNNILEINDTFVDDEDVSRYFRWWIPSDFDSLTKGTYKYTLKLLNFVTDIYDDYEIGILEKEIENDFEDYEYGLDSSNVFVY